MTGWGQEGPLAGTAGHDLTYLALTACLRPSARKRPARAALQPDRRHGRRRRIPGHRHSLGAAGAAKVGPGPGYRRRRSSMARFRSSPSSSALRAGGLWGGARGQNILDGGAPFYRTYRCLDGKYIAVAALEPKFFAALIRGLGLDTAALLPVQWDRTRWPGAASRVRIDLRIQAARRLGVAFRGERCLRRARAELRRGGTPPA